MTTGERYFLVIARELNISRAAKQLFISQQSLSQQIQRLEKKYNTQLFYRKPSLSLTPEGTMLFDMLTKKEILEESFLNEISTAHSENVATIHLGVTASRATLYLADVLAEFHMIYPKIDVRVLYSSSVDLVSKLQNGALDVYIGLAPRMHALESMNLVRLNKERSFVLVSEQLLREYHLDHLLEKNYSQEEIDLSAFTQVPFIASNSEPIGVINQEFFASQNLSFRVPFEAADSQIRTKMCAHHLGFTLLLEPFTLYAIQHNAAHPENRLCLFPVKDLSVTSYCICRNSSFMPYYLSTLVSCVERHIQNSNYETYIARYSK